MPCVADCRLATATSVPGAAGGGALGCSCGAAATAAVKPPLATPPACASHAHGRHRLPIGHDTGLARAVRTLHETCARVFSRRHVGLSLWGVAVLGVNYVSKLVRTRAWYSTFLPVFPTGESARRRGGPHSHLERRGGTEAMLLTKVLLALAALPAAASVRLDRRAALRVGVGAASAQLGVASARAASLEGYDPAGAVTRSEAGRQYFPPLTPPLTNRATYRYELGRDAWALEQLLVFANVSATVRTIVIRLKDGKLWVFSPQWPTGEF